MIMSHKIAQYCLPTSLQQRKKNECNQYIKKQCLIKLATSTQVLILFSSRLDDYKHLDHLWTVVSECKIQIRKNRELSQYLPSRSHLYYVLEGYQLSYLLQQWWIFCNLKIDLVEHLMFFSMRLSWYVSFFHTPAKPSTSRPKTFHP